MGTKYEIAQLRSDAVKRLSYEYPSSLKEFDESYIMPWKKITFEKGITFSVANLAQEIGLTSILPAVFYRICASNDFIEEVLDGERGEIGQQLTLSSDWQRICVLARERLLEMQHNQTFRWAADGPSYQCKRRDKCDIESMKVFRQIFRNKPSCIALDPWKTKYEKGFCSLCVARFKEIHDVGRLNIWNQLPSVFGLPGWDELSKD